MRIVLNLIWLILAGIELAIAYLVAALLAAIGIVTIPLAVPAVRLAGYALWPFGRVVVKKPGAASGSTIGNVVWFVLVGWWLVLVHLAVALLLTITIIGIPLAIATLKMARLALAPYGKDVVVAGRVPEQAQVVHEAPAG